MCRHVVEISSAVSCLWMKDPLICLKGGGKPSVSFQMHFYLPSGYFFLKNLVIVYHAHKFNIIELGSNERKGNSVPVLCGCEKLAIGTRKYNKTGL